MQIELLLPSRGLATLDECLDTIKRSQTAPPFDESAIAACAALSSIILRSAAARKYTELTALAFWIRKSEILRLRDEFALLSREDRILVPCGTVFHLPPRNVDTMFVYSWFLSSLVGNRNVIRLSPNRSDSTNLLLNLFSEALSSAPEPARTSTIVLSYGHELAATAAFSGAADLRVIWGGDRTVAEVRQASLSPHGRELTFPDRYSIAAIKAQPYLALAENERNRLAEQFFNDVYWFDQLACSSPRLVIFCGDSNLTSEASKDFFPRVSAFARRRGYMVSSGNSMNKFVFSAGAILDMPVSGATRWPELTVLSLESLQDFDRSHPGGGLVFVAHVESLADLADFLIRKDQTLSAFGFDRGELVAFTRSMNGRAIDRVVPFGQALQFGRFWDGRDLLTDFCRHVHIDSSLVRSPL